MKIKTKIALFVLFIAFVAAAFLLTWGTGVHEKGAVLKIGVILPLTGEAASYGKSLQEGANLAVDEINSKGGIAGDKLKLVYEDSKADPKTAVSALSKLMDVDKVRMIIGDMLSPSSLAIAPVAQRNKVVMLSPTASAEVLPRTGDYIFSIFPSDAYDGTYLARHFVLVHGTKTVAIVYSQAEAMVANKEAFKHSIEGSNAIVVSEDGIAGEGADLRNIVTKLVAAQPEVVLLACFLPETSAILRYAKELGLKAQFLGISTCNDPQLFALAGNAADGLVFSSPAFDVESKAQNVAVFVSSFDARFGRKPDVVAAYGYDAVQVAASAISKSISQDIPLRDSMQSIRNFPGMTGKTTFNADGGVEKELRLLVVDSSGQRFLPFESKD